MKIYISADIEGITDVTHWDETNLDKPDSRAACEQMTAEVAAACEGAVKAGASEILVKDAHWQARNIDHHKLPKEARLIRGWGQEPLMMVQGLDKSFDAVLLVGFHARSGSGGSPLEHTNNPAYIHMKINDLYASEFLVFAYAAAWVGVPVALVTGDVWLAGQVKSVNPHISTVAVKEGIGESTVNIHPDAAIESIREEAGKALKEDLSQCLVKLPEQFKLEIRYKEAHAARRTSFYPGASLVDPFTVTFACRDYFEALRFLFFA